MQEFTFVPNKKRKISYVVKRQKHLNVRKNIKHIMSGIDFLFERKETQKYTKAMWHENQLIHLYNNNISDGD